MSDVSKMVLDYVNALALSMAIDAEEMTAQGTTEDEVQELIGRAADRFCQQVAGMMTEEYIGHLTMEFLALVQAHRERIRREGVPVIH